MSKHTPLPWFAVGDPPWQIETATGLQVAQSSMIHNSPKGTPIRTANTAFIVQAVNSHAAMLEALEKLLRRDERNTCQHEETTRGGVIWTICVRCKKSWADDQGGKPEWKDPVEWDIARAAIALAKGESRA